MDKLLNNKNKLSFIGIAKYTNRDTKSILIGLKKHQWTKSLKKFKLLSKLKRKSSGINSKILQKLSNLKKRLSLLPIFLLFGH